MVVAPPAPVSEKVSFAADAFFDFDKSVLKPEGKAKLDDLVSKLAAGGMTDAEEQTVLDALTAESDRLKGIGVDPANPIPTP